MWPWSGNASGLGGRRRYERRIELPMDRDYIHEHHPPEGVIVVGAIINDDYFHVLGQNTSALIFDPDTNALWMGVTTNRGTVVVEGSAVLKTKYWNTTLRPGWNAVHVGIAHQRWQDLTCTACDPIISRIHVQTYLSDEPNEDGIFLVQVQVNGAPVPGFHLLPAICRFNQLPNGDVVYSYFLNGVYGVRTIIYPQLHYGREFLFPNYAGIFYAHPVGTRVDEDDWTHIEANIIALPQISNQCGYQTSSGGNWEPVDCSALPIDSQCIAICGGGSASCQYFYYNDQWNLALDICTHIPPCACSYTQQELTKNFCIVYGRMPAPGDNIFLPCCSERS
jgi:hypothetical protein